MIKFVSSTMYTKVVHRERKSHLGDLGVDGRII